MGSVVVALGSLLMLGAFIVIVSDRLRSAMFGPGRFERLSTLLVPEARLSVWHPQRRQRSRKSSLRTWLTVHLVGLFILCAGLLLATHDQPAWYLKVSGWLNLTNNSQQHSAEVGLSSSQFDKLVLQSMAVERPLRGTIQGVPFAAQEVVLSEGVLTFTQFGDAAEKQEFKLSLGLEDQTLSNGLRLRVTPADRTVPPLHWIQHLVAQTGAYATQPPFVHTLQEGYWLELQLYPNSDQTLTGFIQLQLSNATPVKGAMSGHFVVVVDQLSYVDNVVDRTKNNPATLQYVVGDYVYRAQGEALDTIIGYTDPVYAMFDPAQQHVSRSGLVTTGLGVTTEYVQALTQLSDTAIPISELTVSTRLQDGTLKNQTVNLHKANGIWQVFEETSNDSIDTGLAIDTGIAAAVTRMADDPPAAIPARQEPAPTASLGTIIASEIPATASALSRFVGQKVEITTHENRRFEGLFIRERDIDIVIERGIYDGTVEYFISKRSIQRIATQP